MATYIVMHEGRIEAGGRSYNAQVTVEADGFINQDSILHFYNGPSLEGSTFVRQYAAGKWISVRLALLGE
jgi:hypothetical protein